MLTRYEQERERKRAVDVPLEKLTHIDFRKWRVDQTVLALTEKRKTTELFTRRCDDCGKIGLRVDVGGHRWHLHLVVVSTLGDHLLPHTQCQQGHGDYSAHGGAKGARRRPRPPIVHVPTVTAAPEAAL